MYVEAFYLLRIGKSRKEGRGILGFTFQERGLELYVPTFEVVLVEEF